MSVVRRVKSFLGLWFLMLPALLSGSCNNSSDESQQRAGILQVISHPVLDDIREGVVAGLADEGFHEGKTIAIERQNAQGDMATARTIAKKFVQDKLDLIVPLGTQASQVCANETKVIPIVFGAVIDPVGAGLVDNLWSPGGNVTGTRDVLPYEDQIDLLLQLVPSVKKIGMVHNPGEQNSQYAVAEIKSICTRKGLELVLAPASNAIEVATAARSLIPRADALYTAADNTVNASIDGIIKVCLENKKPFLVSDPGSVKKGGLATVGYDYRALGKQTARLAARVLRGKHPARLPVQDATSIEAYVNETTAVELGITISDELRAKAKVIQ